MFTLDLNTLNLQFILKVSPKLYKIFQIDKITQYAKPNIISSRAAHFCIPYETTYYHILNISVTNRYKRFL